MSALQRFAGDDRAQPNQITAASLFKLGYDTQQIADRLNIKEHVVLKRISVERAERLGLERPYERTARAGRPRANP
jgi:hypothetical protein